MNELLESYLTSEQLAGELRLHPRTLRKLDSAGSGPPKIRIGRKILYRRQAVSEWLLAKEERARRAGG